MKVTRLPLSFFVGKLDAAGPVSFARYGDGEFSAMVGTAGANCDGHEYFAELGLELRRTLLQPRHYLHALGPKASAGTLGHQVEEFLIPCPPIEWYSSETFLQASLAGHLGPLVAALSRRRLMIVGPAHLRRLPIVRPIAFVEIERVNCFLQKAEIERDILRTAYLTDVICFSAGMTTKAIIYDLWPHLGQTHSLIDLGSLWDVYCGVDSRRYARRMSAEMKQRLLIQNFGVSHALQSV